MRTFLLDNGAPVPLAPTVLQCDNTSAVSLADHSGAFERTKHFDLKYLRIREYQEANEVIVEWVPAIRQLADALTKNLYLNRFVPLVHKLMSGVHEH